MAFINNNTTTTGAHGNVPAGGDHKPTMGEKIGGAVDKLTGKLTKNEAKIAEGEAKQRGDTVGAQQADAAADAHKNTHGATGNHGTTGTHGTHGAGVAGTGVGAGHHDNTHSHGTGLTGNNYGTTGTGFTGDHHNTNTTGSGITGGTGLDHKAPGEPTMGDKISGNTQAATGRMTNDPVQYAQGQERKTDTSYGNAGGLGAGGVGATGAGLGGHGGHTGHGVAGDTYGTTGTGHGLTGSHGDHSHHATGTGAGVGSGVGHNDYNDNNKPSMGEKISGGMDKMVGKATNDPARVMQGEAKTQGHDAYPHSSGTAGGLAGNTTGYGTGTGAHHTGGPGANTGAGAY